MRHDRHSRFILRSSSATATENGRTRMICLGILSMAFGLNWGRVASAQSVSDPGVTVSGYFDVQAVGRRAVTEENDFQVGQLVVNLSSQLNERIAASTKLAYNVDQNVAIDEAFADWNLYRWDGPPRRQGIAVTHAGLKVGQFNVPFGIDWRVYASVDRKLVSIPMVVANTHRGWNNIGVQFHGATAWSNWSIYTVNGFGSSPALRLPREPQTPLAAGEAAADAAASVVPTEAFGGRLGLITNETFELGASFAAGYTNDNKQDQRLWGVDLTAQLKDIIYLEDIIEVKGEFIRHQRHRTANEETVSGYYVQGMYAHGSFFGVARQDSYDPDRSVVYPLDIATDERVLSTSFGGGYSVGPNAQVRLEYQLAEGSSNDTVFLQTAVAF